jgi:predicted NAD-dependent protein-ADP-ribosyltransferase YbiA (DUF1768 family)
LGGTYNQWIPSEFEIDAEENITEQYMMAKKALLFKDLMRIVR